MSLCATPLELALGSSLLFLASGEEESIVQAAFPQAKLTLLQADDIAKLATLPPSSFDSILTRPSVVVPAASLASFLALLKPGGRLVISYPSTLEIAATSTDLILNGFVDSKTTPTADATRTEITAQRPPWDVNAAAPLKLKKKTAAPVAAAPAKDIWNLSASDLNDADVPLVDENDLLARDPVVLPAKKIVTDCGTGAGPTKKACKNCSCGLAEQQAAEEIGAVSAKPVSSCGSCGLGDAFRCSTCPFLGQPAFATSTSGGVKLAL